MKWLFGVAWVGFAWCCSHGAELDVVPPSVVTLNPAPNAVVADLRQIEATFSEPVTGVDAADLRINTISATNVFAAAPGQYVFEFPSPSPGLVTVTWAEDNGITDLATPPNSFVGEVWTLMFDPSAPLTGVILNEFVASNSAGLRDEDGDTPDWIELRNTNQVTVALDGWFLTDDAANLTKWRFPNVTLEPAAYLVVFASGKNRVTDLNRLHTSFQLSAGGEFLALVNPRTNVVSAFAPAYPPQQTDVAYGRDRLSPELAGTMSTPTPGAPNATAGPGFAGEIRFSVEGGTFLHPFELHLTTSDPAATIRYTKVTGAASTTVTNIPNLQSTLYTGPIAVDATTQIRARAFRTGYLPGPPHTETYIQLNTNALNFSSDLPIVLIHNLGQGGVPTFGDQSAYIAVFDRDEKTGRANLTSRPSASGRIGLNIRGRGSQGYPKSGFAVEFWDEYGQDKDVEVLGMPAESDWVLYGTLNTDPVHIHNPLAREMSNILGRPASRTRFVEVFLNTLGGPVRYVNPTDGNYNGLYVLMEKIKQGNGRVDVASLQAEDTRPELISGGYIFKSDDPPEADEYVFNAARQQVIMVYPGKRAMALPQRAPQLNYVRNYFLGLSNGLWGLNWTNPASGYAQYIDVDSWIDHAMVSVTTFNVDAIRLSGYFYKDRNKRMEMGPIWDCDRALGSIDGRQINPRFWRGQGGDQGTDYFNPPGPGPSHYWLPQLFRDINFWQRYIDRYQVARQGPYALTNLYAIIDRMIAEIAQAQPREQAKWGNLAPPRNTNGLNVGTFATEVTWLKTWLANRLDFMDTNFLAWPTFNTNPGPVSPGFALTLTPPAKAGTQIYYTLDGSDPRGPNGVIAANALLHGGEAILINANTRVIARSYNLNHQNLTGRDNPPLSSPWSGPNQGTFVVQTPPLIVTEIMYHPSSIGPGQPGASVEDYEFIELKNIGSSALSLPGFRFTNGIEFTFTATNAVTSLSPGGYVVVVKNRAAFATRYPAVTSVAGEYVGNLANEGNRLALIGPLDEPILDFRYNDNWYPATDGSGFSLVVKDELAPSTAWASNTNWRASARWLGSPGGPDGAPSSIASILVNEVLAGSVPPAVDAIELFNPTTGAVNIGGWFLTDDFQRPTKFRIPAGTTIPAGGYVFFTEAQFNVPGDPNGFALSRRGDEVYLFSGNGTEITGYFHGFSLGASEPGVSFGRHLSGSSMREEFVAQSASSLGQSNPGPLVGPVVVREICREPLAPWFGTNRLEDSFQEYVELHNVTDSPVPLFDPANPGNTWLISGGVEFTFPAGVVIPPHRSIAVVRFDPDREVYRVESLQAAFTGDVPLYGPMSGRLGNEDDRIVLQKPGTPVAPPAPDAGVVPYVRVEEVEYSSRSPWPTNSSGGNTVLRRVNLFGDANDPANWTLVPVLRPTVEVLTWIPGAVARENLVLRVAAAGSGPVSLQWRANDEDIPGATGPQLALNDYPLLGSGWYDVRVTDVNGSVLSPRIRLVLLNVPTIVQHPAGVFGKPGDIVTFSVAVTNTATLPITYRWRRGVTAVSPTVVVDSYTSTLSVPPLISTYAGPYNVVVSNAAMGTSAGITSSLAPLVVVVPPTNYIASAGAAAAFRATVSIGGGGPIGMQWWLNDALLPQQTNATLNLTNVQARDEGIYALALTNFFGGSASYSAGLGLAKTITLSNPEWRTDGAFRLSLEGVANQNYQIQFASNVPPAWQSLMTLSYTNGLVPIVDRPVTNSRTRFYRALVVP